MNLSSFKTTDWFKSPGLWQSLLQWAGWIVVVFIGAKLFWLWFDFFTTSDQTVRLKPASRSTQVETSQIDVNRLLAKNLMGSVVRDAPKPVEVEVDAPETKLNLKLRGIYAADTPGKANAIIEDGRGQQAVYFIDEKLEVAGRVYLRQVFVDKVILETNGRREALTLQAEEIPNMNITTSDRSDDRGDDENTEDLRGNQQISRKLSEYREQFQQNPASVMEVIRPTPFNVDGEMIGFKISPGSDKRLFQELGLRNGDVVTNINGVALTNLQDAMSLMNDVNDMQEINVEILRGDEQLNLLLNLNKKVGF